MNKNIFLKMFGFVALLGTSFEMRSCESSVAACVFVGTAIGTMAVKTVKNSATYKTYDQHQTRLAHEKEISDNSLSYAQPLQRSSSDEPCESVKHKIEDFEKDYQKQQAAYDERLKPQVTKYIPYGTIIDDYSKKDQGKK
jgi:hypothetical protein